MSQVLSPPPRSGKNRRRRPIFSEKPETRAVQIGILGTILIHLLLLLIAPRLLRLSQPSAARHHVNPNPLNIEIAPDAFIGRPPPKPPPPKFVETNPNAPENAPDKTSNFSNRNQQVAQEKPTPNGKSDHPALSGRKDIQSTQIVDGRLTQPQESTPVTPKVAPPPKASVNPTPRAATNPLAGFEKEQGKDADGFAAGLAKPTQQDTRVAEQKVEGAKDAPPQDNLLPYSPPVIDPAHPQPRRMLTTRSRPAIFSDNKFGTSNIGPIAVDARWSNYGVYLQRMIETVQIEWDRNLAASKIYPNSGSVVSVKFVMNKKGEISKIISVEPTAGTSDAATAACVAAITARAPYGEWTADMIAMLGTEQEMTFAFYYQ